MGRAAQQLPLPLASEVLPWPATLKRWLAGAPEDSGCGGGLETPGCVLFLKHWLGKNYLYRFVLLKR